MKKRVLVLLILVLAFSALIGSGCANVSADAAASDTVSLVNFESDSDVVVSDVMTGFDMIAHIAQNVELSDGINFWKLPGVKAVRTSDATYRSFCVPLRVNDKYCPYLDICCATEETDDGYRITSVYSVQMVREYRGASKQFSGTILVLLRDDNAIEYSVNGDFVKNGKTTMSGGIGLDAGLNEPCVITGEVSVKHRVRNYQYYYSHKTVACER